MADELEKLISGEGDKPKEPLVEKTPEKSEAELKEEEKLANLKRAQAEALTELQRIRKQAKAEKTGQPLEEELPKINLEDPSSKAWDRHMTDMVNPLASELEKEREEVTQLALREFLADKPALAADQEKVKEFVRDYEALSKARGITGRNKDVVKSVMDSAYGAVFHGEVLAEARKRRVAEAQADGILADVATESGATGYRREHKSRRELPSDEREIVLKMYGSEDEYWKQVDAANAAT